MRYKGRKQAGEQTPLQGTAGSNRAVKTTLWKYSLLLKSCSVEMSLQRDSLLIMAFLFHSFLPLYKRKHKSACVPSVKTARKARNCPNHPASFSLLPADRRAPEGAGCSMAPAPRSQYCCWLPLTTTSLGPRHNPSVRGSKIAFRASRSTCLYTYR